MVPVGGHMLVDGLVFARLVTLSSITEMQGNHCCVSGIWGQGHQERDERCMQGDEGDKGHGEAILFSNSGVGCQALCDLRVSGKPSA